MRDQERATEPAPDKDFYAWDERFLQLVDPDAPPPPMPPERDGDPVSVERRGPGRPWAEAAAILEQARADADAIVAAARQEANELIAEAHRLADEIEAGPKR